MLQGYFKVQVKGLQGMSQLSKPCRMHFRHEAAAAASVKRAWWPHAACTLSVTPSSKGETPSLQRDMLQLQGRSSPRDRTLFL